MFYNIQKFYSFLTLISWEIDTAVFPSSTGEEKNMKQIIGYIVIGFFVGLIARAVLPGADHMGFIATTLVGIAGSVIGGYIGKLIKKPVEGSKVHPAGLILSIVGAIVLLLILRSC
jgi:uncharacterized membrane protein YeaQ/YmgE (transglycosylase-associated protein family)